jgi:hypothetical protein
MRMLQTSFRDRSPAPVSVPVDGYLFLFADPGEPRLLHRPQGDSTDGR